MAENTIDPAVIERTQAMLGPYIKKPPLSEKLLKKPPFRFLHDVFRVAIRETGCFQGLYTENELNYESIKDRDDKMRFLQKMIDVIKLVTNTPITVRTSKIVAGQEPEKTNELLQLMGLVIGKGLEWRTAVEEVAKEYEGVKEKSQQAPKKHKEENLKGLDVQEDSRSKIKTKEKIKEKKVVKDDQRGKKSITPTTKDEKPRKKSTSSKDTEKVVPKANNDKPGKEKNNKDKTRNTKISKESTEKSKPKSTKIRTEKNNVQQGDTPSPVAKDISVNRRKSSTIKESSSEEKQTPSPQLNVGGPKERQYNKAITNTAAQEETSTLTNGTLQSAEEPAESEINAQRKSSATLSARRRSSAHKIELDNNETNQQSLSNPESLKTTNGETFSKAIVETPIALNEKSPNETPQKNGQDQREMRREATFARENSKDSTSSNRPRTSLRPPSARPPSARPGAPRRRDRNVEIILQPNDQMQMSGINVKVDTFGNLDDDGENLVIIEDPNADNLVGSNDGSEDAQAENKLEQQGHLVQQILETQKELVQQTAIGSAGSSNSRIGKESGTMMGPHQSSARQVNSLRDAIQNLTKSVNPFGKLMDFIPEHIDAMQLELTMWRNSYLQTASELKRERSLTDTTLEPMKMQLTQIEENTKEYVEMIDSSRAKILQNSSKIIKLLTEH